MFDILNIDRLKGKAFVTADLHLGHEMVLKYRPWNNVDKHDNALINNACAKVGPEDLLIIDGDLTIKGEKYSNGTRKLIERLPGIKVLILGNHDHMKPRWYKKSGFILVATALILQGTTLVVHDPQEAELWPRKLPVICGHWHSTFKVVDNVVNAGVDVWDFEPVEIPDALALCSGERGPQYAKMMSRDRHGRDLDREG